MRNSSNPFLPPDHVDCEVVEVKEETPKTANNPRPNPFAPEAPKDYDTKHKERIEYYQTNPEPNGLASIRAREVEKALKERHPFSAPIPHYFTANKLNRFKPISAPGHNNHGYSFIDQCQDTITGKNMTMAETIERINKINDLLCSMTLEYLAALHYGTTRNKELLEAMVLRRDKFIEDYKSV